MNLKSIARAILPVFAASLLSMTAVGEASARNLSYSAGGGVKCYYVLVSSVNGVNTWQTVCRKGV
jgi:hypothetical protein